MPGHRQLSWYAIIVVQRSNQLHWRPTVARQRVEYTQQQRHSARLQIIPFGWVLRRRLVASNAVDLFDWPHLDEWIHFWWVNLNIAMADGLPLFINKLLLGWNSLSTIDIGWCCRFLVFPQTNRFACTSFTWQIAEISLGIGGQGLATHYIVEGATIDFDVFVYKVSDSIGIPLNRKSIEFCLFSW